MAGGIKTLIEMPGVNFEISVKGSDPISKSLVNYVEKTLVNQILADFPEGSYVEEETEKNNNGGSGSQGVENEGSSPGGSDKPHESGAGNPEVGDSGVAAPGGGNGPRANAPNGGDEHDSNEDAPGEEDDTYEQSPIFTCRLCRKRYAKNNSLSLHFADRHVGTRCHWPGCGFRSVGETGLLHHFQQHQRDAIENGVARETCPWPACGKTFSRGDSVQRCIKRHNVEISSHR
ncbi:hypothetical protein F5Y10DRAFT_261107 [Nemania abortiva]|nr:hypothetical protein F5Y10DRAFT_261107 [Nemania abortiva]